jgi:hypothetical protein
MLRLTEDELNALSEASDARFGEDRQVPRGAFVRLLAEEYLDSQEAER